MQREGNSFFLPPKTSLGKAAPPKRKKEAKTQAHLYSSHQGSTPYNVGQLMPVDRLSPHAWAQSEGRKNSSKISHELPKDKNHHDCSSFPRYGYPSSREYSTSISEKLSQCHHGAIFPVPAPGLINLPQI